MLKYVWTKFES